MANETLIDVQMKMSQQNEVRREKLTARKGNDVMESSHERETMLSFAMKS